MGSKGVSVMVKGASYSYALWHHSSYFMSPSVRVSIHHKLFKFRNCSSTTTLSPLHPSDLSHFVKTAQISLTPNQVEDFAPKIQQVIGWFGQLQDVDLQSIEPSIRAEIDNNLRDNAPETFEHRDAMIGAVPSYEDPYIKVPRVLSMD